MSKLLEDRRSSSRCTSDEYFAAFSVLRYSYLDASTMKFPPPIPAGENFPPPVMGALAPEELRDLMYAKSLLENPGLTARLASVVGRPIEKGMEMLPKGWSATVHRATRASLLKALQVAVSTLGRGRRRRASDRFHKLLVGVSGGIGGAFGLVSLPIELPVSTTIMLRSIADIARSEGHDIGRVQVKLSCLEVFALGGQKHTDDAVESSYWAVRAALAKAVSEAASAIVQRGMVEKSAPAVLQLIAAIASRFGVIVSEQMAAKAIPVVGAAGGSIINMLFMDHFQDMARGHFIVRRLEERYGSALVQRYYNTIAIPARSRDRH